jgi:hypothetical protein
MLSLYGVPQAPDMAYVTKRHLKLDDDRRRLVDGHAITGRGSRVVGRSPPVMGVVSYLDLCYSRSRPPPALAPGPGCLLNGNLDRVFSAGDTDLHRIYAG